MKPCSIGIVALLVSLFAAGCAPTVLTTTEEQVFYSGYDFTPYTDFVFSVYEPSAGTYHSIGIITASIYPEVQKVKPNEIVDSDRYTIAWRAAEKYKISIVPTSKVLKAMYDKAKALGANALYGLKISEEVSYNGGMAVPLTKVTGFAVKQ